MKTVYSGMCCDTYYRTPAWQSLWTPMRESSESIWNQSLQHYFNIMPIIGMLIETARI